jgi:hypothetical protein
MNFHKKSPALSFTPMLRFNQCVSRYKLHSTPSWPVLLCKILRHGHCQKISLRNSGQYDALRNLSNCQC